MTHRDGSHPLESLPLLSPQDVIGRRDLLVVAPHPDDESLGCGGLLAWAAANGRRPRVLFITDGEQSHVGSDRYPPQRLGRVRRAEAQDACRALGLTPEALTFLGAADSGLSTLTGEQQAALGDAIRTWVGCSSLAAVCIPAASDRHGDHVVTHQLVTEALADCPGVRLFAYPVWTWTTGAEAATELPRGRRVDISAFCGAKQRAIAAHRSQHGRLISDAITAFVLPAELLHCAALPFEVLFDVDL